MLSNYFKGIHSNAFDNFEKAIDHLGIEDSDIVYDKLEKDVLFRGRENKGTVDFCNDEMFHIPLNKRGKISTQRYSFPGLPCIYAGASVYTCWVEMNRPSFEMFQVATLQPSEKARLLKVFDLSKIPQRLSEICKESWFTMDLYLCYWLLLALCSVKVKNEDDAFKPEYIFPQFLLEHILKSNKSEEYVGIKYVSIKAASVSSKQYEDDWHTYVNYVFPSHSDSTCKNKCKILDELFCIKNNRSGKELQILASVLEIIKSKSVIQIEGSKELSYNKIYKELDKRSIFTHDGKPFSYAKSNFGIIEIALQIDSFSELNDDIVKIGTATKEDIDKIFSSTSDL